MDKFEDLVGVTLVEIKGSAQDETIYMVDERGGEYRMFHNQDCCEYVRVEDICGDFADIIGSPILMAEESSSNVDPEGYDASSHDDSFMWTFYRISTIKGSVVIRWLGESNGYYSESVEFIVDRQPRPAGGEGR